MTPRVVLVGMCTSDDFVARRVWNSNIKSSACEFVQIVREDPSSIDEILLSDWETLNVTQPDLTGVIPSSNAYDDDDEVRAWRQFGQTYGPLAPVPSDVTIPGVGCRSAGSSEFISGTFLDDTVVLDRPSYTDLILACFLNSEDETVHVYKANDYDYPTGLLKSTIIEAGAMTHQAFDQIFGINWNADES